MSTRDALELGLVLAGFGQLALCAGTLALPRILDWRRKLAALPRLEGQVFRVYAGYIWGTNLAFGLVSALAPDWLLDGSPLATAVAAFICVYWTVRLLLQFAYLDLAAARPPGGVYRALEVVLDALFVALTVGYGAVVWWNVAGAA